jgi:hypothetical protein
MTGATSTLPVSLTVTTAVVTMPVCCSKGAPWVLASGVLGWEGRCCEVGGGEVMSGGQRVPFYSRARAHGGHGARIGGVGFEQLVEGILQSIQERI